MKKQDRSADVQAVRRRRLILIAALNLCLWVVVAGGAVLLVSRRVDLGVETFFREGPATLIAALRGSDRQESGDISETQEPTLPEPDASTIATLVPVSSPLAEQVTEEPEPATGGPPEQTLTPEPSEELTSSPLNLSDPPLDRVMNVDSEMARSEPGRRVLISYSEEALNREVDRFLERYPFLPYERVTVDLQRDRVAVKGDVTVQGVRATVSVVGRLEARDCRPWAEIDLLTVEGMPTPGLFREGVNQLLADALAWYPPDHALCLDWIILEEDQVTVFAERR